MTRAGDYGLIQGDASNTVGPKLDVQKITLSLFSSPLLREPSHPLMLDIDGKTSTFRLKIVGNMTRKWGKPSGKT
jgi:hypothetical protein